MKEKSAGLLFHVLHMFCSIRQSMVVIYNHLPGQQKYTFRPGDHGTLNLPWWSWTDRLTNAGDHIIVGKNVL
ncbi:MAG: hypothetical protein V2J08_16750 [Desulfotignum sp.]|nr:hypothetical protein [Desulfotignum sp.]